MDCAAVLNRGAVPTHERAAALLFQLQGLRLDAKEGKQKQRAKPYARPTPTPAVQVTPGVYSEALAASLVPPGFLSSSGIGGGVRTAPEVTSRMLANIPATQPTEAAPYALDYPMLTRLRTLLNNSRLKKDVGTVLAATGQQGPPRSAEDMKLIWMAFSPPASRRGYLKEIIEMIVLLYRAKEVFRPIVDDPTNGLRFRTWHRPIPEGWSGFDDSIHTVEYVWFARLSAHIYVRLLRGLGVGYMVQNYTDVVIHMQMLLRRPVSAAEWLQ
jgi:hypothetical protein